MSKQVLSRTRDSVRTRFLIGALVACGLVLSLATAYLGLRWYQALRTLDVQEPDVVVWGTCGGTLGTLDGTSPCLDPRTTINQEYERDMAATSLSAAGLFVVAYVLHRRRRSVRERIIRSHGLR